MKVKPGIYARIEPLRPENFDVEVIAMMPMKKNVPDGRQDWELRVCPNCGAQCWYQTENMNLLVTMAAGREVRLLCTECALKSGASTKEAEHGSD